MPQIVFDNGPAKGQRLPLSADKVFVGGRDAQNAIPVRDPMVSRQHFRVVPVGGGGCAIEDMGSVNGTYVNGTRLGASARQKLADGDRIQIGESTLLYYESAGQDPLVGKRVSGFEILARVGSGGMGTVYRARQLSLDRMVALKVLSKELAANRKFTELFHKEARAAGQINHPSIVQVYDVDTVQTEGGEVTFFAMEYMSGGSLEDLLAQEKQLSVDRVLSAALDTARGLLFAEKHGLVHRDIKPGNLMVSDSGMVKIGDLGIARRAEESGGKVAQTDGVSGSPHYISPEQAQGKDLDSGADMYSLGVSLYHLLAGKPPFTGTTAKEVVLKHLREEPPPLSQFRPDVPTVVVELIARLTRKARAERFPDCAALVQAIEEAQRAVAAERAAQSGLFRRMVARARRSMPALVALLVVTLLGIGAGIAFKEYGDRKDKAQKELDALGANVKTAIAEASAALSAGRVEESREKYTEIVGDALVALETKAGSGEALAAAQEAARVLREQIEAAEAALSRQEREAAAAETLAELLRHVPPDLERADLIGRIQDFIAALEQFADEHAGTPAAERAGLERRRVVEALAKLRARLRASEAAFNTLAGKVRALQSLEPPEFSQALAALRAFPQEHPGTPDVDRAGRLEREVAEAMAQAVRKRLEEARALAAEGKKAEAQRRLEALRPTVEGEALAELEAGSQKLR